MHYSIWSDVETRDKGGWTSHHSCLSTASSCGCGGPGHTDSMMAVAPEGKPGHIDSPNFFPSTEHECVIQNLTLLRHAENNTKQLTK